MIFSLQSFLYSAVFLVSTLFVPRINHTNRRAILLVETSGHICDVIEA